MERRCGMLHCGSCPAGDSSYEISNVDPMLVPEIDATSGPKQAGLRLKLRDVELHGLKNAVLLGSE